MSNKDLNLNNSRLMNNNFIVKPIKELNVGRPLTSHVCINLGKILYTPTNLKNRKNSKIIYNSGLEFAFNGKTLNAVNAKNIIAILS